MSARSEHIPGIAHRVLELTRVFHAPRSLVYQAWTLPEHLSQWSAPHGFTIPYGDSDIRPGGAWRCCMRSPDGVDHCCSGVYDEVVENERLIYTHAWDQADGTRGHETVVTVLFAEHNGKTTLNFRQATFESAESCAGHRDGWSQCFDRLGEHLASAQRRNAS